MDKQSGRSRKDRAELANMVGYVREEDTVAATSMDRLVRSVRPRPTTRRTGRPH
ncbi:recombinase family protein [Neoactinobaculum massilliense]|uniref:recombinase family protein n=1 Tax=Neoactinobaculum massilliense TaxID=2364794 RepID=UPI000F528976